MARRQDAAEGAVVIYRVGPAAVVGKGERHLGRGAPPFHGHALGQRA
ncbi:hypothetical protein LP419_07960 [Massilia sp. H-1]|nr:hypothetical protein LP419_07960 [Massilia sp. H-1]